MRESVPRHGLRWLVVAVVLAIVATMAVALQTGVLFPPVASDFHPIAETADPAAAFAAAKRQNRPVVVTSLGTPTRKVSARPDGSLTAELSTVPMQVQRGQSWVPVDTELAQSGNTVAPRTVSTDVVFSGSGNTPLVRFGAPGKSLTLSWPTPLPKPTLDGADATYPDVLPGVDLVLQAQSDSFSQHLIVKTPAAAAKVGRSGSA